MKKLLEQMQASRKLLIDLAMSEIFHLSTWTFENLPPNKRAHFVKLRDEALERIRQVQNDVAALDDAIAKVGMR